MLFSTACGLRRRWARDRVREGEGAVSELDKPCPVAAYDMRLPPPPHPRGPRPHSHRAFPLRSLPHLRAGYRRAPRTAISPPARLSSSVCSRIIPRKRRGAVGAAPGAVERGAAARASRRAYSSVRRKRFSAIAAHVEGMRARRAAWAAKTTGLVSKADDAGAGDVEGGMFTDAAPQEERTSS
ncbi:hypothetical protein FB451DRAFT_1290272 [Mycena latifolia]|nr:hypothetical protein FB451DRAFT_1290272 [Mycena latifolia]